MSSVLEIVTGVVLGGLITIVVAAYYFRRTSEELRTEVEKLRRATSMIIVSLVKSGHINPENVKIDPETDLVEYVLVLGAKKQQMTMHPGDNVLIRKLQGGDPLPRRPWWRRLLG